MKSQLGWAVTLGILAIVLGFIALIIPLIAGIVITIFLGVVFLIYGIFHIVYAFSTRKMGAGWFVLQVLLGILYLIAGSVILKSPWEGLTILTLIVGILIFIDGIIQVINAFDMKPLYGWGWGVFSGILGVILGILIWSNWPVSSIWTIGTLVGVNLITNGLAIFKISSAMRQAIVADVPSSESVLNEG
ncbi:MAG: HdeD family acid-resistance protein [Pleurocapsa sp. MO_226.B13]|nr:HdeD family acid-resistance protein [Pleurocapsa sp. MO_226.B13]